MTVARKDWPIPPAKDPRYTGKAAYRQATRSESDAWVREGHLVCRRLRIHDGHREVAAGECAITSLVPGPNGVILGATSGARAHLIVYYPDAPVCGLADLGVVGESCEVKGTLVAWDDHTVFAGTSTGQLVKADIAEFWVHEQVQSRGVPPARTIAPVAEPVSGEGICALVGVPEAGVLVGLTQPGGVLFTYRPETGEVVQIGAVDEIGMFSRRLIAIGEAVFGARSLGRIYRFTPSAPSGIEDLGIAIPHMPGRSYYSRVDSWVHDTRSGTVYGGDEADGLLFAWDVATGKMRVLGKPVAPPRIRAIAVTSDGRVYGMAGDEGALAHLFCWDPATAELRDLGVPLATIERRWYGYEFDAACTGPQGEIYFGESDRVSHLFIYVPAYRATSPASSPRDGDCCCEPLVEPARH